VAIRWGFSSCDCRYTGSTPAVGMKRGMAGSKHDTCCLLHLQFLGWAVVHQQPLQLCMAHRVSEVVWQHLLPGEQDELQATKGGKHMCPG
jgi:hypothetical protein